MLLSAGRLPSSEHPEMLGPDDVLDEEVIVAVPARDMPAVRAAGTLVFDNRPGLGPLPPEAARRRPVEGGADEIVAGAQRCDAAGRCRVATLRTETWLAR